MEPALQELYAEGMPEDEVAVILRLADPVTIPPGVRIVARFGHMATCRLKRADIPRVWGQDKVLSMKRPRSYSPTPVHLDEDNFLSPEITPDGSSEFTLEPEFRDQRRPDGILATGRGVAVAHIDWGVDFAHSDFRKADGRTRLLALWDQSSPYDPNRPNIYGYGRIYYADDIDQALTTSNPYTTLGYDPAVSDPGSGTHGTHTLSISAGNGRGGGPAGLAPDASLIFVHLSTYTAEGPTPLGDSVAFLEGLHFISQVAGPSPLCINASLGRQAGQHDSKTLTEQAMDFFLLEAPGRAIIQSAGNYFNRGIHTKGTLRPGESTTLRTIVNEADQTPNEVDLWYPGVDRFQVTLHGPRGAFEVRAGPEESRAVIMEGREVGHLYHRINDPNNGDNQVTLFLYRGAPHGEWGLELFGEDVADGRFHAWIERDAGCGTCQARFAPEDNDATSTLGTICTGLRTLAVGAYDGHQEERPLAPFSSSGTTRDGRQKPDCVAPGVRVLAARSRPRLGGQNPPQLCRMSGTSMAAPHVTGTIALMFEAAAKPLSIDETRRLLLANTDPVPTNASPTDLLRLGSGYLNTIAAVAEAEGYGGKPDISLSPITSEVFFDSDEKYQIGGYGPGKISADTTLTTEPAGFITTGQSSNSNEKRQSKRYRAMSTSDEEISGLAGAGEYEAAGDYEEQDIEASEDEEINKDEKSARRKFTSPARSGARRPPASSMAARASSRSPLAFTVPLGAMSPATPQVPAPSQTGAVSPANPAPKTHSPSWPSPAEPASSPAASSPVSATPPAAEPSATEPSITEPFAPEPPVTVASPDFPLDAPAAPAQSAGTVPLAASVPKTRSSPAPSQTGRAAPAAQVTSSTVKLSATEPFAVEPPVTVASPDFPSGASAAPGKEAVEQYDKYDDAEARRDKAQRRVSPPPFQFQVPLTGGAPALAVPVGGSRSPLAFTVPLGAMSPATPQTPQVPAPSQTGAVSPANPAPKTNSPSWPSPAEPTSSPAASSPASAMPPAVEPSATEPLIGEPFAPEPPVTVASPDFPPGAPAAPGKEAVEQYEKYDDAEAQRDKGQRGVSPPPFQFQVPLTGGAPALAVPVGGHGSPFAFTVPFGSPAPGSVTPTATQPDSPILAPPRVDEPPVTVAAPDSTLYTAPAEGDVNVPAMEQPEAWEEVCDCPPGEWSTTMEGFSPEVLESENQSKESLGEPWNNPNFGERVLQAAELVMEADEQPQLSSAALLGLILNAGTGAESDAESTEALSPLGQKGPPPSATELFSAFVYPNHPLFPRNALHRHYSRRFQVLAHPGQSLYGLELRPGDLLLRVARGEKWGHVAVIASRRPHHYDQLGASGLCGEGYPRLLPGLYVQVVEICPKRRRRTDRFARRFGDGNNLTLPDTLLLRPLPPRQLSEAQTEPGQFTAVTGAHPCPAHYPLAEDIDLREQIRPQQPPAAPARPDSPLANRFVPAHPTRFCTPGQARSGTCRSLAAPRSIRRVVIHALAVAPTARRSGVEAVVAGWQNAGRTASSHYLVDRDGTITQMVREGNVAFHTPGNNSDSIGIEHADICNDPSPFTNQLYERSAALVRDLATRHGFPINNSTVAGHNQVNPNHGDPGPYWDWEYYFLLLAWAGTSIASRPIRLVTAAAARSAAPAGWQVRRRRTIANDRCASHRDPWGPAYWFTQPSATGAPAELSLVVDEACTYKLSLWWPAVAGANPAVPLDIEVGCLTSPCNGRSTQTVTVNQRSNAGRWNDVATVRVTQTPAEVTIRWRCNSAQQGLILVDGVRLLKIATCPVSSSRSGSGEALTVTDGSGGVLSQGQPLIRRGDTGPVVKDTQRKLNRVHKDAVTLGLPGLAGCPLVEDGCFEERMQMAMQSFQQQVFGDSIEWGGIVSPETLAQLDLLTGTATSRISPAPAGSSTVAGPLFSENVPKSFASEWSVHAEAKGSGRQNPEYIRWVQSSLNRIMKAQLAVDGLLGEATRSALRKFQQQRGLTADGVVGPRTEAALIAASTAPPPSGVTVQTQPASSLAPAACAGPATLLERFGHDQTTLTANHKATIEQLADQVVASQIRATPIQAVCLSGHTDNSGDSSYNQTLGMRRAESAGKELKEALERRKPGLASRISMSLFSFGEKHPVASNATADGQARNRRVEIVFLPTPGCAISPQAKDDPSALNLSPAATLDYSGGTLSTSTGRTLTIRGTAFYPAKTDGSAQDFNASLAMKAPIVFLAHGNHATGSHPADRKQEFCLNDPNAPPGALTIPNHQGYQYFQEQLARMGIISVSVDCNETNCSGLAPDNITERAELIAASIKHFQSLHLSGDRIFGGRIEFEKVGLMGHSRGAEAVLVVPEMTGTRAPAGVTFKGVLSLAPTDAGTSSGAPRGFAFMTILPAGDGDVATNDGAKFYDKAVPSPFKCQLYVEEANHNFFNTEWVEDDPHSGPALMSKDDHKRILSVYGCAFFRKTLLGQSLEKILTGQETPPGARTDRVQLSAEVAGVLTVEDHEDGKPNENTVKQKLTKLGFAKATEHPFRQKVAGAFNESFFGNSNGLVLQPSSASNQFTSPLARVTDLTGREIWIRSAEIYTGSVPAGGTGFKIGLVDARNATVFIDSDETGGLPRPFDRKADDLSRRGVDLTKTMLKTFRFPANCFTRGSSLDITKVKAVVIHLNRGDSRALAFDQLQIV